MDLPALSASASNRSAHSLGSVLSMMESSNRGPFCKEFFENSPARAWGQAQVTIEGQIVSVL